jgi:hypothetical protein
MTNDEKKDRKLFIRAEVLCRFQYALAHHPGVQPIEHIALNTKWLAELARTSSEQFAHVHAPRAY